MRSIYDNAVVQGYAVQWNTTGATVTLGASVDSRGYNTAALRVFVSPTQGRGLTLGNGGSLTAVLQESSDNVTFATANDNTGAAIQLILVATTTAVLQDARIEGLNLSNRKRYLRVQTTANFGSPIVGNNMTFTSCAVLELARAYQNPVTTVASNT